MKTDRPMTAYEPDTDFYDQQLLMKTVVVKY